MPAEITLELEIPPELGDRDTCQAPLILTPLAPLILAIAGLSFLSFAALEAHLSTWIVEADARIHGTTHERPCDRFDHAEKAALRPLPERGVPSRERRMRRRVANDCFVDVDTIRYSVPHRFVGRYVDVLIGDHDVQIFDGATTIARHRRCFEPHARVDDPAHFDGIFRRRADSRVAASSPLTRSLDDYASCIGGES